VAFATAQEMLDRIDSRWLCQLVFDDNTVATEEEFLASTRVADCLDDASGMVLAYALQGKRYSVADLEGLTGVGQKLLVKITVDIAAAFLAEARQLPAEDIARAVPGYGRAMQFLEQLQLGNIVFHVEDNMQAGLPSTQIQCSTLVSSASRLFGDVRSRTYPATVDGANCCPPPDGCC
jgi:phage gp36-like protein